MTLPLSQLLVFNNTENQNITTLSNMNIKDSWSIC